MALPQPSQPAHTLPGELALGLALVINSLGVVLMLRSGGESPPFPACLTPCPWPCRPSPLGTWTYLFQGRWWPGSWCCAGGLSPPICSASWWGSCSASCWTFRRGGSPPAGGAALAGGVFPAELPADLPGHRPVQPVQYAHYPHRPVPREVAAITGLPYARVKIGFGASCLAGTVVLTLCCLGQVEGLGIGTVAAALTMGKVIGWMGRGWRGTSGSAPRRPPPPAFARREPLPFAPCPLGRGYFCRRPATLPHFTQTGWHFSPPPGMLEAEPLERSRCPCPTLCLPAGGWRCWRPSWLPGPGGGVSWRSTPSPSEHRLRLRLPPVRLGQTQGGTAAPSG